MTDTVCGRHMCLPHMIRQYVQGLRRFPERFLPAFPPLISWLLSSGVWTSPQRGLGARLKCCIQAAIGSSHASPPGIRCIRVSTSRTYSSLACSHRPANGLSCLSHKVSRSSRLLYPSVFPLMVQRVFCRASRPVCTFVYRTKPVPAPEQCC
jgi:hypothetical protein